MRSRTLILFIVVTALGLLAGLLTTGPASAQDSAVGIDHNGAPPDINAGPASVEAHDTVTVSVVTETPPNELGAWTIAINYNPLLVQPVSCTPFFGAACGPTVWTTQVRIAGADINGVSGTANLGDITFKAIGPAGKCSFLDIVAEVYADATAPPDGPVELVPDVSDGEICITNACADISGDGYVRARDVVAFIIAALFRSHDPRFDLNGDGVANFQDVRIALGQLGSSC